MGPQDLAMISNSKFESEGTEMDRAKTNINTCTKMQEVLMSISIK